MDKRTNLLEGKGIGKKIQRKLGAKRHKKSWKLCLPQDQVIVMLSQVHYKEDIELFKDAKDFVF